MKQYKSGEGFFLLDAVIALLVAAVIITEIVLFTLAASHSAVKTNTAIRMGIEKRNSEAGENFEFSR